MLNYIKKYIRKYIPKIVRILRESLYIDLMRMFGKRTSLLGMKEFPINLYGKNAFFTHPFKSLTLHKGGNEDYFAQFYGESICTDYVIAKRAWLQYASEVLPGKIITKPENFDINTKSVLPISIVNKRMDSNKGIVSVVSKDKQYDLNNLKENRFHYIPLDSPVRIIPRLRDRCIVGKPISLVQTKKTKKKLVLSIFVDGLAGSIFDSNSFEEVMPNTKKYFESGSLCFNGYASSNWTLASTASLFSGLYPINHKMYDANNEITLGDDYKTIGEYFSDAGFLTGQICSNFRKSPTYGYMKGFDRTLYKRNMSCNEVITYAMEHLRAFSERSNYLWLTFFETHHFLHGLPDISIQTRSDMSLHDYADSKLKSVHSSYDDKKTKIYIEELKRIDFYLEMLFNFIKKHYKDEDVVVSICSDHGKGFIGQSNDMLAEHRIKAPLFFKSIDTKNNLVKDNRYAGSVDYLPSLLELSGINYDAKSFDGESIFNHSKKEACSEILYVGDYYRTAMYTDKYIIKFVSSSKIFSAKEVDYDCGEYTLYRKKNMEKVDYSLDSALHSLVDEYKKILQNRIR